MAISDDSIQYYKDQLATFGPVRSKRMFGGVGFFHQDIMFAMLDSSETFRLRADEVNEPDFVAAGMTPFTIKMGTMPYWEVPEEVYSDSEKLAEWAQKSFEAALRKKR
ncbi:MAG: TfoX/Sxy family protein [Bacteroidetes bacterium]|nr:TfoX/Sxy family protein [Bacteroidota bacterium]